MVGQQRVFYKEDDLLSIQRHRRADLYKDVIVKFLELVTIAVKVVPFRADVNDSGSTRPHVLEYLFRD